MNYLIKIIPILIIVILNSLAQTPVEKYGSLQVIGKNLCDSTGNAIQLRGLSTHGIQYFNNFYNENIFASIAQDWNADVIRIASYVNEGWGDHSSYLNKPEYWRARIDTLVGYATKNGLYVIIDWHMLIPGNPNAYLTEAKAFWLYMVEKYGDKKNVLFEICNEPNDDSTYDAEWNSVKYTNGVTWKDNIKNYAEEIIPIIRSKSDNVIIVGTEFWAQRPDLVVGDELAFDNVMYTVHFYAADHKEGVRQYIKNAMENGIAVFVTEFGTQAASGDGENDFVSSDEWLDFLDSNKISWVNWNLSNDQRSGAIYNEYFDETSIQSYSDTANLKEAGQWVYNRLINGEVFISKNNVPYFKKIDNVIKGYTSGNLMFSMNFKKETMFSIYNTLGKSLFLKKNSGNSINVGPLSKGVYIIKIKNDEVVIKDMITIY